MDLNLDLSDLLYNKAGSDRERESNGRGLVLDLSKTYGEYFDMDYNI